MPKVSDSYLENKRNAIIDAAFRICNEKPVYAVTMKDVVRASGLSHGGVYRFFDDIDDVFAAMINRYHQEPHIKNKQEELLATDKDPSHKIIATCKSFGQWIDYMVQNFGKFAFEMNMAFISDTERLKKIQSKIPKSADGSEAVTQLIAYMDAMIDKGYFAPKLPKEQIFTLFVVTIDGIVRDTTISNAYHVDNLVLPRPQITAESLMETLAESMLLLLNQKGGSTL